ncbi:MAG TPA: hypothetical protein VK611_25115 [Acidimicrobiales bacterium]|nr:hypothetical protein [Acidimicrobiales bacterium]
MTPDTPTLTEVGDFTADLRDLSRRLMRFEDIPAGELADFHTRKQALLERIEPASTVSDTRLWRPDRS